MAQHINSVVLSGNLTRDPELRTLPSGYSVCSMRIANNRRRKIQDEWQDAPGYYDVTVWGKQGENCARFLEKGRGVLVKGELRWREWEKDGVKRSAVDINADEVQFLGGGDRDRAPSTDDYATDVPIDMPDVPMPVGDEDSDIPFLWRPEEFEDRYEHGSHCRATPFL